METNNEDAIFRELMAKSKLSAPFSDLEDKIMIQLNKNLSAKNSTSKELKMSWVFFIFGTIVGIFISAILPTLKESILGVHLDRFSTLFQIIFTLLFITQLDSLLSFYKKYSFRK